MTHDEFRSIIADLNAIPKVSSTAAHIILLLFAAFFFFDMISLPFVVIRYGMDNLISAGLLCFTLLVAPALLIWAIVSYRNKLDAHDASVQIYLEQLNETHVPRGLHWEYVPSATRSRRQIVLSLGNQQPGVVFAAVPAAANLIPVQMYTMPQNAEYEMQVLLPPAQAEQQPLLVL